MDANPTGTNETNDVTLLTKLNQAVAAANEAEKTAEKAKDEFVSRSKAVGLLLVEAKKLHPKGKDFEAFLGRVDGLKLSRAYDLMRLAGGRVTDEELKKEARERKQKSRAIKKKLSRQAALKKPEPEPDFRDKPPCHGISRGQHRTAPSRERGTRPERRGKGRQGVGSRLGRIHRRLPDVAAEDDRGRSAEGAPTRNRNDERQTQGGGRVMVNRDSIIDKIKALLAKTTANGATEAEMLSALDKASAMMDAYDITDEELQIAKDEAAILHADPPDLSDPHKIKWRLSRASANFAMCRFTARVIRPASSALGCRATCSSRCGCSTTLPTLCSPNFTRT